MRGVAEIEVSFELNVDGILNVTAAERSCGMKNRITITNDRGRLTVNEIAAMIEEAKLFEIQDEKLELLLTAKQNYSAFINNLQAIMSNKKEKSN